MKKEREGVVLAMMTPDEVQELKTAAADGAVMQYVNGSGQWHDLNGSPTWCRDTAYRYVSQWQNFLDAMTDDNGNRVFKNVRFIHTCNELTAFQVFLKNNGFKQFGSLGFPYNGSSQLLVSDSGFIEYGPASGIRYEVYDPKTCKFVEDGKLPDYNRWNNLIDFIRDGRIGAAPGIRFIKPAKQLIDLQRYLEGAGCSYSPIIPFPYTSTSELLVSCSRRIGYGPGGTISNYIVYDPDKCQFLTPEVKEPERAKDGMSEDQQTATINGVDYKAVPSSGINSCSGCAFYDTATGSMCMGLGLSCINQRRDHREVIWVRQTDPLPVPTGIAKLKPSADFHDIRNKVNELVDLANK